MTDFEDSAFRLIPIPDSPMLVVATPPATVKAEVMDFATGIITRVAGRMNEKRDKSVAPPQLKFCDMNHFEYKTAGGRTPANPTEIDDAMLAKVKANRKAGDPRPEIVKGWLIWFLEPSHVTHVTDTGKGRSKLAQLVAEAEKKIAAMVEDAEDERPDLDKEEAMANLPKRFHGFSAMPHPKLPMLIVHGNPDSTAVKAKNFAKWLIDYNNDDVSDMKLKWKLLDMKDVERVGVAIATEDGEVFENNPTIISARSRQRAIDRTLAEGKSLDGLVEVGTKVWLLVPEHFDFIRESIQLMRGGAFVEKIDGPPLMKFED